VTAASSGVSRYVPVQTEDFAEFYEASYRGADFVNKTY